MFVEPMYMSQHHGWIEVICGSMFSGKTEELIRRIKRARYARMKVEVFKPSVDNRYSRDDVVSHDEHAIRSMVVQRARDVLNIASDVRTIGIDEAQFFDDELVDVCQQMATDGRRVIVAGLDMDFQGQPFGPMPSLLAVAEHITKVHAICVHCGQLASHSYRRVSSKDRVLVGEKEAYEPRCRRCFLAGQKIDFHTPDSDNRAPRFPDMFGS